MMMILAEGSITDTHAIRAFRHIIFSIISVIRILSNILYTHSIHGFTEILSIRANGIMQKILIAFHGALYIPFDIVGFADIERTRNHQLFPCIHDRIVCT